MLNVIRNLPFLFGLLAFAIPLDASSRVILFDVVACLIVFGSVSYDRVSNFSKLIILSAAVYIFGLILSSFVNGFDYLSLARRLFGIAFLTLEALAVRRILSETNEKEFFRFIVGSMIGIALHINYPTDDRVFEQPIKFLIGLPLGVILIALGSTMFAKRYASSIVAASISFIVGVLYLYGQNRSIGGVFIVAGILMMLRHQWSTLRHLHLRYVTAMIALIISIFGISEIYTRMSLAGLFGPLSQQITDFQVSAMGNVLLGGRPEVYVNIIAFLDRPLLGHGPFNDNFHYLQLLASLGTYSQEIIYGDPELLYHSMIFTGLQETGLFSIPFWLLTIYLITMALFLRTSLIRGRSDILLPILLVSVWHVLFSPLIPYNRWPVAIALGVGIWIGDEFRRRIRVN